MLVEALRAPEVAKCQQKYRVDWDATDGRYGGAQQTVWEILLEMERVDGKSKGRRSRSLSLGPGLGEGLRAGKSSCGVGLGDTLQLPKEDIAGAVWLLRVLEASAVWRMCGGAAPQSVPLGTRCSRWKGLTTEQSDHAGVEVIRVCVTTKMLNDAKKYGPHEEHHFFLRRNMSRGAPFSCTQLVDVRLTAGNDPL